MNWAGDYSTKIANYSVGKSACNMSRRYMSRVTVTVDMWFVIEERTEDERTEDELPEQMLGCICLHRLDHSWHPHCLV